MRTRSFFLTSGIVIAPALAMAIAGCGGASINGTSLRSAPSATPAVLGLDTTGAFNGTHYAETSGYGNASGSTAYATGATALTATAPDQGVYGFATIPLGFAPGAAYMGGGFGGAAPAGGQVMFAADIENGTNSANGTAIPINPNSVFITTPEVPSFKEQLTFQSILTGSPLADGTYRTGTFTLPFTTTGMHTTVASVSDTTGTAYTTTFQTVVLAPGDSAVIVQVLDSDSLVNGSAASPVPVAGATVSITNALSGVTAYNPAAGNPSESVTDAQGVAIVFAAPGAQTISATYTPKGATVADTGSDTETLTAGQLFNVFPAGSTVGAPGSAYTLTINPS